MSSRNRLWALRVILELLEMNLRLSELIFVIGSNFLDLWESILAYASQLLASGSRLWVLGVSFDL